MVLICSVCGEKAEKKLVLDCQRFEHRFFYCLRHTPNKAILIDLDKNQDETVQREMIIKKGRDKND